MPQQRFWQKRLLSLTAVVSTLAVFVVVATRAGIDTDLLADYGIIPENMLPIYLALALLLLPLVIFEPRVRGWLGRYHAGWVLLPLAGVVSAGAVLIVGSDQSARLFRYPPSLWFIIIHIVGLCALLALLAVDDAFPPALTPVLKRRVAGALAGVLLLMGVMYTISRGEFMPLDMPDEPWMASTAANFALNNDFSPSYIASAYGSPDPALGRYFLVMGWWLRLLNSTTLVSLRSFPLLVGLLAAGITMLALRRAARLSWGQVFVGGIALLGFSAFLRASHNLRADIGLAVYGALVLWGQLAFFRGDPPRKRWLVLTGLALYIGLETITTIALIYGASVGLVLVIWWLSQPRRAANSRYVWVYAFSAAAAVGLYLAVHFLPDIAVNLENFGLFNATYGTMTALGSLRNLWPILTRYYTQFSLILSPVELLIVLPALLVAWKRQAANRWLLGAAGLALGISLLFVVPSYGYLALFAPLAAYAAASLWQTRVAVLVGLCVFLPAFVVLPVCDLAAATQQQKNTSQIAQTLPLLETLPEDTILVGEPLFWFSLHPDRTFISWTGISRLSRITGESTQALFDRLDVDVSICWTGYESRCNRVIAFERFSEPSTMVVDGETYWVSRRADWPDNNGDTDQ
jgi:hypothetical protein